jgi:phosphoglucomutase
MTMQLDATTRKNIDLWLSGTYDEQSKAEIQSMIERGAVTELTDAFYKDLEFGTGGLRGIMGVGSNRINRYTIAMATQGLANYLKQVYANEPISVAIAHDCRNNATTFAQITADVFSANGIKVFLFSQLRPTPQLSFAIRELGCKSGVMLTASHNPKEYSGYKAYWSDGGQLIAPHDKNVVAEVGKIASMDDVKMHGNPELIEMLGDEMDERYLQRMLKESISKDAIQRQSEMKIVFSPIHGTGYPLVPEILKRFGFTNVILVDEQCIFDGNFPTVVYPNPEEHEALTMAIDKARETGADLVMATDPDADRVGIAIRDNNGEVILLNGNQTGSLLMHYVLNAWKQAGRLDGKQYVVKTIVTSQLMDRIAESLGVTCYNVLTGFKFIGDIMTRLEGEQTFIVGGEESYGYLVGEHARDKDAVIAAAMIAEMAAYYRDKGQSLYDALINLYLEHGYYKEKLISITKTGKSGAEEIKAMMKRYREDTPVELGGSTVTVLKDYASGIERTLTDRSEKNIDLPKSDVLQFITEDGSVISARPSGTEPKIKFYCSVRGVLQKASDYERVSQELENRIDAVMNDLGVA